MNQSRIGQKNQAPGAPHPAPGAAAQGSYVPPPPAGYPTMSMAGQQHTVLEEIKSRGDGFWKGCCAALCCCCAVDACF